MFFLFFALGYFPVARLISIARYKLVALVG
jgi:hypothetical protein